MRIHEKYIERCLKLASNGLGHTKSNPLVGCVIVKDNKIIGEGYHHQFGGKHAEVLAWENAGKPENLENCTVYINLEPCAHIGKTGSCAQLLTSLLPKTVVISQLDPNPLVNGKGVDILKSAGIEVIAGILEKDAKYLNRRFNTFHLNQRPYIILKWAQTSDGFIAPINQESGNRFIISNDFMHTLSHSWRAQEMGIAVGNKTITNDNAELTVRLVDGDNPVRVILDKNLKLTNDLKIFNSKAHTIVFNCIKNNVVENVEYIKLSENNFLAELFENLWKKNIVSIIAEGGSTFNNSLINANIWDEMRIITSDKTLITGLAAPKTKGKIVTTSEINGDRLEIRINEL